MGAALGYPRNQNGDMDVPNKQNGILKRLLRVSLVNFRLTPQEIEMMSLNLNSFPRTSGLFLVLKSR